MKMLIASLALCCLSVLFFVNDEASRLLSVRLLDEKEWNQIQEQRQEGEVDYTLLLRGPRFRNIILIWEMAIFCLRAQKNGWVPSRQPAAAR